MDSDPTDRSEAIDILENIIHREERADEWELLALWYYASPPTSVKEEKRVSHHAAYSQIQCTFIEDPFASLTWELADPILHPLDLKFSGELRPYFLSQL